MDAHAYRTELPVSQGKGLQNDVKNNDLWKYIGEVWEHTVGYWPLQA